MEQYFQVGVISSTHGIRGEVKVYPTTDDPARFRRLKEVLLDTGGGWMTMELEQVRFFKQMVIVKFKGYDSINEVEKYRNKGLFVPREQAVPLEEGEYYIADLLGMKVFTEDGGQFGTLRDVMQTGANDVYVIDSLHNGEVLVPAIADCVLEISVEQGWMKIHLLDGLLDQGQ
ncbi:MAG: 16S rRNA processing protein RimM [Lachnospiraceae bacterium]|nr:16S rRNA processing protein RimM [Lachnospiraceae bacterium]